MSNVIVSDVLSHFGIDVEDALEHYGKKGMKWGVTRQLGPDGKVTNKVVSEDHAVSRELKAKKQSEMSNNELTKLNTRLQLEKTNNELQTRSGLQKIKQGTAIAGTILAVGATVNTAIKFVSSPAGKAIIKSVNDVLK